MANDSKTRDQKQQQYQQCCFNKDRRRRRRRFKSELRTEADEIDCWNLIAPLRSKHNPLLLTKNPVKQILSQCQKQGKRFVDRAFPPVPKTRIGIPHDRVRFEQTVSRFANLCRSRPSLFSKGVDPDDVVQGRLGNCWFLQCIAALATRPHLIERLIFPKTYSPEGVYTVKVFDEGEWYYILIDDYMPCQGNNYSCCRSRGDKIWPQILEKAYAKLHTCFQSMVGGSNTYCFGLVMCFVCSHRIRRTKFRHHVEMFLGRSLE